MFNGWFGVFQISENSFLDGIILVIKVDSILEPESHDSFRDVEEDNLVWSLEQTGPPRCRGLFRGVSSPAILCHKEPAWTSKAPRGGFETQNTPIACSSLVLYGIRAPIIGPFRAWKPTNLMPYLHPEFNLILVHGLMKTKHSRLRPGQSQPRPDLVPHRRSGWFGKYSCWVLLGLGPAGTPWTDCSSW